MFGGGGLILNPRLADGEMKSSGVGRRHTILHCAISSAQMDCWALQGAQRQTVISAKLVLSQTTRFKFKHQPIDLLTASSLPPRAFLVFSH